MARLLFGGDDVSMRGPYGSAQLNASGRTGLVYADATTSALADIVTYPGGVAIAGSVITVTADSQLPLFQGPADGTDTLYVSVDGGTRTPIYTNTDVRLDLLTTNVAGRLNWRGAWAATTAYVTNDVVTFNGGLYRAPSNFTSGGSFVLANWVELVVQSGTYASLALPNSFRDVVRIRKDDSASPSSSATINMKPAGDGTAAAIAGYHMDSVGYIIHLTDGSTMTGDGLIGLGIQYGNAGLVLGLHGSGKGISMQTDAGVSANGIYGAHLGSGDLVKLLQGQSGTPGTLLTLQGWSGAPAASRIISIQNTSGQEMGYWNHDGTLHIPNVSTLSEVTFTNGSGGVVKLYADTGAGGGNVSVFTSYIQQSTNRLLLRSGTGATAKGSESMATLFEITNGNSIAFFGASAVAKQTVTGAKGSNAALASLLTALANYGLITDSSSA